MDATYDGAWELPVLGAVTAPAAVLIRPDGYVAWAGELGDPGLADALADLVRRRSDRGVTEARRARLRVLPFVPCGSPRSTGRTIGRRARGVGILGWTSTTWEGIA